MTRLDVPQFFGLLTAALAIAKVFGSLAKWISQPAVLGEWSAEFSHSCVPLLFTNDRESFDAVVMLLVELSQLRRRPLYV